MTSHTVARLPKPVVPHSATATERGRLASFAQDVFAGLPRADQRRWAGVYLQGLLTASGKKSIRQLAAAVGDPSAAPALQQFVNASPWDWNPVRSALLRHAERRAATRAWTVGLVVIPKRGELSVGVHRRFVPALGRTVNCQAGVGIFLAGDDGPLPVDWRMLLSGRWSEDEELRSRTRIPAAVRGQSWSAQVLSLIEALAARTPAAPPIVLDMTHDQQAGAFARALVRRRYDAVLAVPSTTPLVPVGQDGEAPDPAATPVPAGALLAGRAPVVAAVQADGGRGRRSGRLVTRTVRLSGVPLEHSVCRLFAHWPPEARTPSRIWLTNLVRTTPEELLALTRAQEDTTAAVDRLTEFGLSAFEGRSYPGWHHHLTLVCCSPGPSATTW
ncbi:transposase [Streptomyces sp. NPDC019937]|uniref:IS701 family transposase n=1 Tax=Streptomyces sp. NPDC019937 TaxID=3154787 RepID=UPI0033DE6704